MWREEGDSENRDGVAEAWSLNSRAIGVAPKRIWAAMLVCRLRSFWPPRREARRPIETQERSSVLARMTR